MAQHFKDMKTYSSKSIGNCLCTLAFAVVGALCALLVVGTYAGFNWNISGADVLVKLGVVLATTLAVILISSAVRRTYRGVRLSLLNRRRARS